MVVKEGISTFAALHLHPEEAQRQIRDGAEAAVRRAGDAQPWSLPEDATIELEFDHQARADHAAGVPGVERAGNRVVSYRPADGLEFLRIFRAAIRAASIRMSP